MGFGGAGWTQDVEPAARPLPPDGEWVLHTLCVPMLPWRGVVRFELELFLSSGNVEVGRAAIAQVGASWNQVAAA